jgi:hypothetical protein
MLTPWVVLGESTSRSCLGVLAAQEMFMEERFALARSRRHHSVRRGNCGFDTTAMSNLNGKLDHVYAAGR